MSEEEILNIHDCIINKLSYFGFEHYPTKIYKNSFEDWKSKIYYKNNWIKKLFSKMFPVKLSEVKRGCVYFHIYENNKVRHELCINCQSVYVNLYHVSIGDNFNEKGEQIIYEPISTNLEGVLPILLKVDNLKAIQRDHELNELLK